MTTLLKYLVVVTAIVAALYGGVRYQWYVATLGHRINRVETESQIRDQELWDYTLHRKLPRRWLKKP